MGRPYLVAEMPQAIAQYDPEELRRRIATGGADEFANGLIAALKPRIHCDLCQQKSGYQRWAYNLFAKVAKLAQSETVLLVAVLERFGVKSETELKELAAAGRKLERLSADATADLENLRDEATDLLVDLLKERPEWRHGVLVRLDNRVSAVLDVSDAKDAQAGHHGNGSGAS